MAIGSAFLDSMKKAAGLTATFYDSQVHELIDEARAEMARIGIDSTKAADEADALVSRAIRTYVCANFAETEPEADRLLKSYESQISAIVLNHDYQASDYAEEDE